MRTYDPARASIKQVLDLPASEEQILPVPEVAATVVEPPAPPPVNIAGEFVSILKDLSAQLATQLAEQSRAFQADGQKSLMTLASGLAIMDRPAAVTQPPSPVTPCSYVFEIERDANGRISRVVANPVVKSS